MRQLLLLFTLCATVYAVGHPTYEQGKLLSITDSHSNRQIGSTTNGNGSIITVTDVEYRLAVQVGGMVYTGSYWPRARWSYVPTDLIVNDPVEVRIDRKHMYLKRPNGKELKTDIVQRSRVSK